MTFALITHEVEDYAKWRKVFDESQGIRDSAGLGHTRVYQDANDPNLVTVMSQGELSNLQAFSGLPELKAAMEKAGAKGNPQVMYVNDVT